MSEATVAFVRRTYEVINAIGRTEEFVDPEELAPDVWARLAPDFELHDRPDLPDAKVYRGLRGRRSSGAKFRTCSPRRGGSPSSFDLGDAVVVEGRVTVVGRGSDVPIEADETDVFHFRDGMLVRLQGFPTREDAMRAARDYARPEEEGWQSG